MNKSLQEQLVELEKLFVKTPDAPDHKESTVPQVRRWVVWRKNGHDYRKVCMYDSMGDDAGRVVSL